MPGRYLLDPDKIAAWGGSAGGYLSSMLGVSAGVRELEDLSMGNPDQPALYRRLSTGLAQRIFSRWMNNLPRAV